MTTRLRYALLAAAAFASATLSAGLVDDWGFTPRTHTSWSSYWDGNQRVYEETVVATDNWTYASGVLSGTITSNDYSYWSSRCELATPPGRGWVSLKWRVVNADDESQAIRAYGYSYGNGSDGGELYVYNTSGDYGSAGYQSALIPVRSSDGGTVEIGFSRDSDSPNLKLLVTDITWTPDTSPVTILFNLTGGRFRNGTSTATLTRTDVYGSLPEPVRDNCTFLGWSENARSYNDYDDCVCEDTPLPMETNVTLYATWDIPVEEALDPTGALRDESRGNWIDVFGDFCVQTMWDWRYETNETGCVIGETEVYAGECAELTVENDGSDEIDLLTLNVHGCGYLDFGKGNVYYGCCARWGGDLALLIDGEEVAIFETWEPLKGIYEIRSLAGLRAKEDGLTASDPAYDLHEVRLVARPDEEHSDMSQFSFMILPIRWTEVSGRQTVTFDARGGASVTSRSYAVGAAYGSLPTPTRAGATFLGWFTKPDGGEQVAASELLRPSVTTLYARWAAPLTTALGGELTVTSKNGTWCGAADVSRQNDGSWSASVDDALANLLNGTTCVMSTTVQGRGIVSFWWMEGLGLTMAGCFYPDEEMLGPNFCTSLTPMLSLWVDGKMVAEYEDSCSTELLSFNSIWKHLSYAIAGDGEHTVEWRYGAAYLTDLDVDEAWIAETVEETNEHIEEMRKLFGGSDVERVYPPGAWVQDVSWRPEGEVNDLVTWARAAVEGGTWLTDELASIESFYAKKIKSEPKNYEWRVLRALTTLAKLGEDDSLLAVLKKFGFVPDYQNLGTFTGSLTYSRAPLSNAVVDSVAQSALPALNAALADLEAIPDTWTGSVALSPNAYPVDETTYVDLADVTFARAAVKGALATLAIAQGYDLTLVYAKLDSRIKAHDNNGKLPTVKEVIADHPSFLKSVRNKTRLAEGKTLLRSALELAQAADRRILARTSDELHFLEYDEADADELQFARDEVAKALASLDATVVLTDDDFARAKNYRLQGVNQRATLKPFFAGAVTRSLLPTKYDTKGVPLVSSLPDATFGGILPGLKRSVFAQWLRDCGLDVEAVDDDVAPGPVVPDPVVPDPVDPDPVNPDPIPIGDGGILCPDVGEMADLSTAQVYNGCLFDADGRVSGTFQVKAAKAKTDRKTGATTSKVTVTVLVAGEKKTTASGTLNVDDGTLSLVTKDGRALDFAIGSDGVIGTFGDYSLDGVRDLFSSKDKAEAASVKSVASAVAEKGALALVWADDADAGWNFLTVTVTAKGKAKVSGTLANGAKVSTTAQMVVGEDLCCIPVTYAKKGVNLSLGIWIDRDEMGVDVTGLEGDWTAGYASSIADGACFFLDCDGLLDLLGDDTYLDLLPDGMEITTSGTKWTLPKAGKVVVGRDGEIDWDKAGENPSGLKLSYKAKGGSFTGSFKAYVDKKGKPKATSVTVCGVVVDGVGYGTAKVGRLGAVSVMIE